VAGLEADEAVKDHALLGVSLFATSSPALISRSAKARNAKSLVHEGMEQVCGLLLQRLVEGDRSPVLAVWVQTARTLSGAPLART